MWSVFEGKNRLPEWQRHPYRIGRVASGRTVLVTGATSEVGRKVCRALIDRGDRLIVLVKNRKRAENIFGPHAMIITDIDVIGSGTPLDAIFHLGGWWFGNLLGKGNKIVELVTGKTMKQRGSSAFLEQWFLPFY